MQTLVNECGSLTFSMDFNMFDAAHIFPLNVDTNSNENRPASGRWIWRRCILI